MELLKQLNIKKKARRWTSWSFVSTLSRFISATSNFFSSKKLKAEEELDGIYGWKVLVLLHTLNNVEITNYFKYEPRFNGVFSRNNLPRIKDEVYVINLDGKNKKGTYWVSLFIDRNSAVYFDSFGIEFISQEVLKKNRNKSITHNIFRIQDNESIMCRFYCIAFI